MSEDGSWPPPLSDERAAQIKAVVMAEVLADGSTSRSRHRRRVLAVIAGVIAVLLAGAGTAAAYLRFATPDEPNLGYCSPAVSADPAVWQPYAFGAASDPDGNLVVSAAVDVCGAMWRAGIVTAPGVVGVPPELNACVVDGSLVVFAADAGVCGRLGLPQPRPESSGSSSPAS